MKKIREVLGAVLLFSFIITISCIIANYATYYFFNHYFQDLSEVVKQIITLILAFVVIGGIASIAGRVFHHPHQRRIVNEVLHAIKSISRGDYNVSVKLENMRNGLGGEVGKIIDSFNHMAVNLNQLESMRQEFITNVSHEIQSPLTSIKGFAKVLQNDNLPLEERKQYLSIIEYESTRLSKLSDNLLKLTSLESQSTPLEKSSFSLNNQLMYTILSCEPQIIEKNINIIVNLHKIDIVGDEVLLNQVWMNLITNSIKFTPVNGEISISISEDIDKVIVNIKDTGIGISDEDQVHIFERFYKADKSRDRTTVGNGLGLSIVRKIVEMHDGIVFVESEVGKGSVFIVELPILAS